VSIVESPVISVLIIVKDEPEILNTLEILKSQCIEMGAECIVVDASEHRLDSIRAKHPWVTWLDYQQPSGRKITIAHQRNVAVSAAQSSVLLFCEAGGTPSLKWVHNLSKPLIEGKLQLVGGPMPFTSAYASTFGENLQEDGEVLKASATGNIGFTRAAYDLVEGFNEDLDYGSDADFIWKLAVQGIQHICIKSASVGIDGGSARRELKRNWIYGKAIVPLLRMHPEKRREKLRSNPELWVYPALILIWVGAILAVSRIPYLFLVPIFATLLLILKNIKNKHPLRIVFRHYVYGAGSIYKLLIDKWNKRKISPILIFPRGENKYTSKLMRALNQDSKLTEYFPKIGPSATLNIFLMPIFSMILKLRGVRLVHIHWLYSFNLHWSTGNISRLLMQSWFRLWVVSLKIFGIRIAYTVHNLTPHEIIFHNDYTTFQFLERHANFLILLNERSFKSYSQEYPNKAMALIPEGPLNVGTAYSKKTMNKVLNIHDKRLIVLVGNLSPYKQVDLLVNQSRYIPSNFALRIAGNAADRNYREILTKELAHAQLQGIDVDIHFGHLTDNVYGGYLSVADYFCVPFKEINNSGSINSALCAGIPVIVPNIPSLDWVPDRARFNLTYNSDGNLNFKELFQSLGQVNISDYESMRIAALKWASKLDWQDVAEKHIDVYGELGRRVG